MATSLRLLLMIHGWCERFLKWLRRNSGRFPWDWDWVPLPCKGGVSDFLWTPDFISYHDWTRLLWPVLFCKPFFNEDDDDEENESDSEEETPPASSQLHQCWGGDGSLRQPKKRFIFRESGSAFLEISLKWKNLSDNIYFYLVLLTTLPFPPPPALNNFIYWLLSLFLSLRLPRSPTQCRTVVKDFGPPCYVGEETPKDRISQHFPLNWQSSRNLTSRRSNHSLVYQVQTKLTAPEWSSLIGWDPWRYCALIGWFTRLPHQLYGWLPCTEWIYSRTPLCLYESCCQHLECSTLIWKMPGVFITNRKCFCTKAEINQPKSHQSLNERLGNNSKIFSHNWSWENQVKEDKEKCQQFQSVFWIWIFQFDKNLTFCSDFCTKNLHIPDLYFLRLSRYKM